MKAIWKDTVIADSDDIVEVEGNAYFPLLSSLRREHVLASDNHTTCPWKGRASYYTLKVGDALNRDAAWFYQSPSPTPRPWPAGWHSGAASRCGHDRNRGIRYRRHRCRPGRPFLAAKLVAQGRRVALIESRDLGGTCVNRGCTPTKTLRKSARVAYMARRAAEFGVRVGPVEVDFAAAMQRMKQRVDESRAGLQSWLGGLEGLTIIKAHGRLAGRNEAGFVVEADQRRLAAPGGGAQHGHAPVPAAHCRPARQPAPGQRRPAGAA